MSAFVTPTFNQLTFPWVESNDTKDIDSSVVPRIVPLSVAIPTSVPATNEVKNGFVRTASKQEAIIQRSASVIDDRNRTLRHASGQSEPVLRRDSRRSVTQDGSGVKRELAKGPQSPRSHGSASIQTAPSHRSNGAASGNSYMGRQSSQPVIQSAPIGVSSINQAERRGKPEHISDLLLVVLDKYGIDPNEFLAGLQ